MGEQRRPLIALLPRCLKEQYREWWVEYIIEVCRTAPQTWDHVKLKATKSNVREKVFAEPGLYVRLIALDSITYKSLTVPQTQAAYPL